MWYNQLSLNLEVDMRPVSIPLKLSDIETNLSNGTFVIPDFQRDFVWDIEQSAQLLDSWIKGYPLGAFILWTTDEQLCKIKQIGNTVIYDKQDDTAKTTYILDGQQRITSIFAAIKGLTIKNRSYADIIINLEADLADYETDVVTVRSEDVDFVNISFAKLCENDLKYFVLNYPNHIDKISAIQKKLNELDFPSIKIDNVNIDVATDIFTRLNTGGKKLTPFEIITAKTYKPDEFNLVEKAKECRDNINVAYKNAVADSDLVKMVALCVKGGTTKNHQLKLTRNEMIDSFDAVVKALNSAISFCIHSLKIPVGNMIAYTPILYLYVYFFYKYNKIYAVKSPSKKQQDYLIDYYWRCVLNGRFGRATDTKIAADAKNVIDKILSDDEPEQISVSLSVDAFIINGSFAQKTAYIKGLIGLLMSLSPKSLSKNSLVSFDQNWISMPDKNNYHHFFPVKMVGQTWTNEPVNNICNIILQDASTNQVDIGNRRPSDYIDEFYNSNSELQKTLNDHLIFDIDTYGIKSDDFETFIKKRASAFIEEIKARLVVVETDAIDSIVK